MRSAWLAVVLVVAGCGSSGGDDDDVVDAALVGDGGPTVDAAVTTDGAISATDGASADAAAGFPNLPGPKLFRFGHMQATGTGLPTIPDFLDACVTRMPGGTPVQMYAGTAGIGRFQIGAWRVLDVGNYALKVIAAGGTCADASVFDATFQQLNDASFRRYTYLLKNAGSGSTACGSIQRSGPSDVANQDIVFYSDCILNGGPTVTFTDGAGTVTFPDPVSRPLAPGRNGTITMHFANGSPPDLTRAFRSATGQVSLHAYGVPADNAVGMLLCDDLAAPVGHLSLCNAQVRAP